MKIIHQKLQYLPLQRGAWKSNNGDVINIFVNISDKKIEFETTDLVTGKMIKILLDPFDIKIIEKK